MLDGGKYGVSIGAYKFDSDLSDALFDEIEDMVKSRKLNLFYEDALKKSLDKNNVMAINVRGYHWIEIDNIAQFEKAKKVFGDITRLKKRALELGAEFAYVILPQEIIFDPRAYVKCFNCKNYNTKHTCPPEIPYLKYKEIILSYKVGLIAGVKEGFTKETFPKVRRDSTNKLHNIMITLEKEAFNLQNHFSISFIGGSCRLCPDGCAPKCKHPDLARIPVEATGVDVIETLNKFGVNLEFPVKEKLYRVGLLMVG